MSPSPSRLRASSRVFDLSLGQMLWSRRTIFMGLLVAGPVLIAVLARVLSTVSAFGHTAHDLSVTGPGLFGMMVWLFYLRFIVPVLGVFYGTALIADEVEDKTITYLFTRPIARGAVLLGKYLAYLVCTIFVVLPSVALVYLLVVPIGGSLGEAFLPFLVDLGLLALGLAVYGAVFAFVGAVFRRPLLTGLVFVLGWEPMALVIPGYLKKLTVAHYLQGLAPHAMPVEGALSLLQSALHDAPSTAGGLTGLLLLWGVFLWLAMRVVERREFVLEQ